MNDFVILFRQGPRFLLADAFGVRQFARDFLVPRQLFHVFGRRDDGHPLIAPLLRLANALQLHARALGGQLLPVSLELGVVGNLVVVAEIEPKRFLGRGYFRSRLCGQQASGQGCYNHEHWRAS